ncbi:hypothetical protein FRC06_007936 [Ceratobasidium sp. 370]|nr:hypothetical protein FRC06_007936 [Ceratobasidium sp. 370]
MALLGLQGDLYSTPASADNCSFSHYDEDRQAGVLAWCHKLHPDHDCHQLATSTPRQNPSVCWVTKPAIDTASFDFAPSKSHSSPQNCLNRSQTPHKMPPCRAANQASNPATQEELTDGEAFAPRCPKWKAEYSCDGSHVRITDQHSGEKHVWDMIERPAKVDKCKLDHEMKLDRDPENKDRHDLYLDIQNKIRLDMHAIMGRNAMTHKWGQVSLDVRAKIALAQNPHLHGSIYKHGVNSQALVNMPGV